MAAPVQVEMGAKIHQALETAGFINFEASRHLISGPDSQILSIPLKKGEEVLCQPGAMKYLSPGIKPQIKMGDCGAACCGGEALFRVKYKNESGEENALVGLGPPFPAKVIPVDLAQYNSLVIKAGAFLAATDVNLVIGTERIRSIGAACGGMGLLIHPITGTGTVFLNAGGTILFRPLKEGEVIYASTNSVVAFQKSCKFTVEFVGGGCGMACCGGEGMFNVKLVGPGLVILQSLSFEDMAKALAVKAQG